MIGMAQVAERLFNQPLAVSERTAAALDWLIARAAGGPVSLTLPTGEHRVIRPQAGTLDDRVGRSYDAARVQPYSVVDGVAVIPIEGALVHKGGWIGQSCGLTSYQGLQAQVVRAAADSGVRGVVFEVDSGGGEISGVADTADLIYRLSVLKPTMAILTDAAYSAAYWLASQARKIVVPENGGCGSIGCMMLHMDMSGAYDEAGVKVTMLTAGAHKADGWPYAPLGDDAAARIRADLEAMRQVFAGQVARGRGKAIDKAGALKTEALDYRGRDAVRIGLADAVGNPHDAFASFREAVNKRGTV